MKIAIRRRQPVFLSNEPTIFQRIFQMGVKSTIAATPPTVSHQMAAIKVGINAAALLVQLQEHISEAIYLLQESIKTFPNFNLTAGGTISTGSANIVMAKTLPATVVSGMNVFDVTNQQQIGTVSSGAGTTTLVLQANAAHAGSGSSDVLQFTDANLATYQSLITSLS
jgi:hypothetical protein